jgi:hypothetical protein
VSAGQWTDDEAIERLYWFYKMVDSGGPDGSELDLCVYDEAREAIDYLDPRFREVARGWEGNVGSVEEGLR